MLLNKIIEKNDWILLKNVYMYLQNICKKSIKRIYKHR